MIGGQLLDLSVLPALTTINLGDNLLDGAVPAGIWSKANLVELDLADNGFVGSIASMNLPDLTSLNLTQSGLGGPIPVGLWSSTDLTNLDLSENGFTGGIDAAVGNLILLTELDLSDNQLTGVMPASIRPLLVANGGVLAAFSSSGNLCFTPETPEVNTDLLLLDPDWNEAGVCPP
jgi:Leucine-rich repeat (LRR) protein